jgi:hypothetical protein
MKKIVILAIAVFSCSVMASCREKPVTFDQLPTAAKSFINANFAGDKVVMAKLDDDLIRPDYEVRLSSGVELKFNNSGSLEKVASHKGISADLIPHSIREFVSEHYPTAGYRELEIGRRTYEVKLTNGLELKFNSAFHLVEMDD